MNSKRLKTKLLLNYRVIDYIEKYNFGRDHVIIQVCLNILNFKTNGHKNNIFGI